MSEGWDPIDLLGLGITREAQGYLTLPGGVHLSGEKETECVVRVLLETAGVGIP